MVYLKGKNTHTRVIIFLCDFYAFNFINFHVTIFCTVTEDTSSDQKTKKLKFDAASRPPYSPPKRPTTPVIPYNRTTRRYSGRFKSKLSSVYRSSPLNEAVADPDNEEPVTIQVFVSTIIIYKLNSQKNTIMILLSWWCQLEIKVYEH